MTYERGDVVWGPAPHKSGPSYRPWVLVSDSSIPFAAEESIALGITTREREPGIRVPEDAWVRGGSREQSYVSPWYVTTLKHRDLDRRQGRLDASLVSTAVESLHDYTPT